MIWSSSSPFKVYFSTCSTISYFLFYISKSNESWTKNFWIFRSKDFYSATLKQVPLITDNTSKLKYLSFLLKPKNRNLSLAAFCWCYHTLAFPFFLVFYQKKTSFSRFNIHINLSAFLKMNENFCLNNRSSLNINCKS